ncbi:unnamed protein product [Heligmosomoides polygyrus]|uniref:RRP12-like protein n=1 Tax=Heligmosomoides polygyrus TaxID=6339 RepID=A0A3P7WLW4_HELPZ|nr:unnamed protein product [Heligmosomoides polygyrus]
MVDEAVIFFVNVVHDGIITKAGKRGVANPNELPNKGNPDYQDNAKPNNQAKNFSGGESTDDSTGQAVPACSSPSVFFNPDMRNFLEKEYDVSAVKVTRRKSHPSRKKGKQRHHSSSKTKPEVARDAVDNAKDGVENAKRDGVDNAKQDGMDNAKHDDVDNAKREDKKNDGVDDAKHDDKKHRLGARGAVKMPKAMVKKAMGSSKPGLWFRKKASLRHFKSRKFSREKNFPFRKSGEIVKDNEKEKGKQREKEKDKEKAKQAFLWAQYELVGVERKETVTDRRSETVVQSPD